ncbi:hypothetical protein D8674_016057 [Pyrus ussuriensis x Pyrus communis]|uniref:Uncharacterized protein n=1 Tax=Pyrus ussuriensis x Pyrus communis TaxID=2448454 RepID=A0A5N5HBW1_9ROSA|nr:hypothetical protein D8674_016057 [Pyrus ussuriensis x Pyrus communis]
MKFSYCLVFVLVSAASIWNISANSRHQLGICLPFFFFCKDKSIGGRKVAAARLEDVKVAVDGAIRRTRSSKTLRSSSDLEGKSSCGNVECKENSTASRFSEKSVDHDQEYAGFVAFSQDYHSPRHHPPKNN